MKKIILGILLSTFALVANSATWQKNSGSNGGVGKIFYECKDCVLDYNNKNKEIIEEANVCSVNCQKTDYLDYSNKLLYSGSGNSGILLGDRQQRTKFSETLVDNVYKLLDVLESNTMAVIKNDGYLWISNNTLASPYVNSYGQLGLGYTGERNTILEKTNLNNVNNCHFSTTMTICVKNDGTVFASGNNNQGQLGVGDTTQRNSFTQAIQQDGNFLNDVKNCFSYGNETFCLKNNGDLYVTGIGYTSFRYSGGNNIHSCSSNYMGGSSLICVLNNGNVVGLGNNYYGQLGIGNKTPQYSFVALPLNNIIDCEVGPYNSVCVKNDGTVWASGMNGSGQLGLGDTTERLTMTQTNIDNAIKCFSYDFSIACVKNDGTVWASGMNGSGQLGVGDTTQRNVFTQSIKSNNTPLIAKDCKAKASGLYCLSY